MKSNEEFIAGIYEKAANYVEKEKKTEAYRWKTAALRIAAAAALCTCLAGLSAAALWHGNGTEPPKGNDGIALFSNFSEEDDAPNPASYRMLPEQEQVMLTGTLESIDEQEGILWVLLESWDETSETAAEHAKTTAEPEVGAVAAIVWNILEEIPTELVAGTRLMAAGEAGTYGGAELARYGAAQLTLTDKASLWLWIEEENTYKNVGSKGQE